jgi:glucan phosphoethanolaminetransferase (alkaline phosphatase superfamily)
MTEGFQIHHSIIFFIPIMALFTLIQLIALRRRRRGLEAQEWPRTASVLLLVALCVVIVFSNFR